MGDDAIVREFLTMVLAKLNAIGEIEAKRLVDVDEIQLISLSWQSL